LRLPGGGWGVDAACVGPRRPATPWHRGAVEKWPVGKLGCSRAATVQFVLRFVGVHVAGEIAYIFVGEVG